MLRALAVAAAVALAAAACGDGDDRPALPISLGAGGGERAATAMAEDSVGGAASMIAPAAVKYELDADTSGLPDEGPAYEVKSKASESDVREVAKALGLDGDPKKGERDEWYVSGDGGALLTVEPMSGSPWYFQSEGACAPDTPVTSEGERVACGGAGVSSSEVAVAEPAPACKPQPDGSEICEAPTPSDEDAPTMPARPERPANMLSEAEAEATARALLDKLGVDLEGASVHIEDGFSAWYAVFEPRIDGLRAFGFGWSVAVGPDNVIQSASGHLGEAEKVADYPLLDVEDAIEQLSQQFAVADIAVDCSDTPSGQGAGTEALCADVPPAEPLVQRITAVELGLVWSPSYTGDGPGYLTPAWILTIEGGGEMPVNALPQEYVQQPDVEDVPEPRPLPADGGGTDGGEPGQTEPGSPGIDSPPAPDQG